MARPRWHKPALLVALAAVIVQVVVFVVLRSQHGTTANAPARDALVIVVGPGTPSASSGQIRNVFLGRAVVWPNGTPARPVDRPADSAAAKRFHTVVLKLTARELAEQRLDDVAPPSATSGADTVATVAATTGGIGYVLESELPDSRPDGVRLVRIE